MKTPQSIRSSKNAQNSAENSAKKVRGNPDKITAFQFKPGQSGNPGGRPKEKRLTEALRRKLAEPTADGRLYAEALAECLISLALDGDISAIREIADRTDGKPTQAMELSGPDGGGIPSVLVVDL